MNPTDRLQACADQLLASARQTEAFVTGDLRVFEDTAAELLGIARGTLSNWRANGSGPSWSRLGGRGHKVSYYLRDLATFLLSRRVESSHATSSNAIEPHAATLPSDPEPATIPADQQEAESHVEI